MLENKLKYLSKILHYEFENINLLRAALTHRSTGSAHNERLEFLGDSVLNFIISKELYKRFPEAREGELTRLRARLVRKETLKEIARHLTLGEYLQLGPGEQKSGGHQRDSILADSLEAILGALFLDGGLSSCEHCLSIWYQPYFDNLQPESSEKDAKTRLQEYLQRKHLPLPLYSIKTIEGDPHAPTFHVECKVALLSDSILGIAKTRRLAEQMAAELTLKKIQSASKAK